MFCSKCGADIENGATFCKQCGHKSDKLTEPKQKFFPKFSNRNKLIAFIALIALLACVILGVSSCSNSPRKMIIGKWKTSMLGETINFEFDKSGVMKISGAGEKEEVKYSLDTSDKDNIKLVTTGKDSDAKETIKIKFENKDKLLITPEADLASITLTLERVK